MQLFVDLNPIIMKENILKQKSFNFSIRIINLISI